MVKKTEILFLQKKKCLPEDFLPTKDIFQPTQRRWAKSLP
jgi:hypothetical protein